MKKTLLFAIFLATFAGYSQAPRGFYATAGITQTELKSSDLLSTPGIGYKTGLNFNMGYHENYNYQIEMLFNHRALNFKTVSADYQTVGEQKYISETIDVGFYFNYYILKPEEDKFFLGPQIGFAAAITGQFTPGKTKTAEYDFNNYSEESYNEYNHTQGKYLLPYLLDEGSFENTPQINFDAGLGLTGGYNDWRFDLRYTKGLNNRLSGVETNNYDESHTYTGPALSGKLNTISFSVSYLFWKRISKK
jgi:hypothetical protein